MAKSGRLELGGNIYRYCKSIFNHCDVFGQQSNRIRQKKEKGLLRRSRSFKVIEVGTNRKPVMRLPISDNWTFFARCYGWGATGENRSKIGDFAPTQSVWPKISGRRGHSPPIIFAWIVRLINALQLCRWQFTHKKTLQQTFFKRSAILEGKRPFCVFEPQLGDLGATYDDHLRLVGKRGGDFLLVLIELFW